MLNHYIAKQPKLPGTGLPPIIVNKIKPNPIEQGIATDLAKSFQEQVGSRSNYDLNNEIVEIIERNYVRLIIFDDADYLNEDCFNFIRNIFDDTGCPIVLVGLPSLWRVIQYQVKFKERIGLKFTYSPVNKVEMLNEILPNLKLPHWHYDPHNKKDKELGEYIWTLTNSSLWKVQHLLQNAEIIAELDPKYKKINKTVIREAKKITPLETSRQRSKQDQFNEELDPDRGQYEIESERRHDRKRKGEGDSS